jgi:hypothetical protein
MLGKGKMRIILLMTPKEPYSEAKNGSSGTGAGEGNRRVPLVFCFEHFTKSLDLS